MSEPLTNDPPPLEDLLAMAHDEVYAPILLPKEYKRMAAFLASRGVVCPVQDPEVPDARPLPAGHDRDALAALLSDLFPTAERSRWPFSVQLAADRLIAAGVTLSRPAPETALDKKALGDAMWNVLYPGRSARDALGNLDEIVSEYERLAAAQGGDE